MQQSDKKNEVGKSARNVALKELMGKYCHHNPAKTQEQVRHAPPNHMRHLRGDPPLAGQPTGLPERLKLTAASLHRTINPSL